MDNGKKLIAIENIIFLFAQNQFTSNNIQPLEARIVMEAVDGKFQKICLDSVMMNMVQMVDPNQAMERDKEEHTGTPEDLKKSMKDTGFIPDDKTGERKK